ncbi:MAG: response regulator [Eubacteriales bacterium]
MDEINDERINPELTDSSAKDGAGQPVRKKLLVTEDNKMIRMIILHSLGDDYLISCVSTGSEAVRCVQEEKPDMIIADLDMPNLDGGEFLEKLAQADAYTIPVVFLVSKKSTTTESRSLALGFRDYYIRKPFSEEDLTGKVERILNTEETWRNLQEDVSRKPEISGSRRTRVEESLSQLFIDSGVSGEAGDEDNGAKAGSGTVDELRDLSEVQAEVSETGGNAFGACEVSFSEFCVMYRLMQRQRERKDVTAQIVMFTMYPKGDVKRDSVDFEGMMAAFTQVVSQCLRRCDVTVRYTSCQLLAMFMDCYQKDGRMVADRIMHNWKLQDMPCEVAYEIRTFPL